MRTERWVVSRRISPRCGSARVRIIPAAPPVVTDVQLNPFAAASASSGRSGFRKLTGTAAVTRLPVTRRLPSQTLMRARPRTSAPLHRILMRRPASRSAVRAGDVDRLQPVAHLDAFDRPGADVADVQPGHARPGLGHLPHDGRPAVRRDHVDVQQAAVAGGGVETAGAERGLDAADGRAFPPGCR